MSDSGQEVVDKWKDQMPVTVTMGNRVDYLIDGWATFAAMYDAINSTFTDEKDNDYYIYILGWWLDDSLSLKQGDAQSSLQQLLVKASACKVQVRVILWDNLFQKIAPTIVGSFNRNTIMHVQKLPTGVGLLDAHQLSIFGSHHQKIIVVKGLQGIIGFCGGVDISQDRLQPVKHHPGAPYHDVHCRIQGDGARGLLDVFVQRWMQHPDHDKWDKPYKQGGKGVLRGLDDVNGSNEKATGSQYVAIGRTFNRKVNGKPCASDRSVLDTLSNAINSSAKFIYIEDQYLVSLRLAELLQKQLSKIAHLLILIPHSSISDLPKVRAARARFALALQKDKKLYQERVGIYYKVDPASKKPNAPGTYVHAKTWIFDDELAVIGSANVNERGISYDSEVIAAIFDRAASASGDPSFAQTLRNALWIEHLGLPGDSKAVVDASANDVWDLWAKVTKDTKGAGVLKYDGIDSPDPGPADTPFSTMKRIGWDEVQDTTYADIPPLSTSAYNALVDINTAVNIGRCNM